MKKQTKKTKNQAKRPNLWHYLKNYKLGIFFYLSTILIASACGIFITIISAEAIELITLGKYAEAIKYGFIVLGITVIHRITWYTASSVFFYCSNKVMADINFDLARQAFKLNSKTYSDHETGTFVLRIVDDPEQIIVRCGNIVDVFTSIISSLIMLIYITTLNLWISLILVVTVIVGLIIEKQRIKLRRKNWIEVRKNQDSIHSLTTEIVRSEKDIKSLGLEDKLSEVSEANYVKYRNSKFKYDMVDSSFAHGRAFIVDVVSVLILVFGVVLIDKALLTLAAFIIIRSNSSSLYNFIWNLGFVSNCITDMKVSHERMFSLFDEQEFVTERFGKVNLDKIKGNIEFKNVSYSFKEYDYEDHSNKKKKSKRKRKVKPKLIGENQVFSNLSFKIKPNSTVAFVGKSGSGKSTILNLMSKMYEVDAGEILIDGVNINDLNKETLRKGISLVNQFPYLFDMTIKENLLLGKGDATDEDIYEALNKASLKEFVEGLPKGINTRIGESGIKLSGGQKQRLAIARALLRKSSVIIFDESTSSLDNFAQEEVKRSIDNLKGKSTIVIVAHRLSTIKNVDKIFFLDNGEIVDHGTFDELFERNDKFKAMFLAENI